MTCATNPVVPKIHDRMQVVVDERAAQHWMNPWEQHPLSLKRLLTPAHADLLLMRRVSPLVSSVKNHGPKFLEQGNTPLSNCD